MNSFNYLLYSGSILAFLTFFYWLFLRKETFFLANRWILLGNIVLALIIPLMTLPEIIVPLKKDLVESFQPTFIETTQSTDNESTLTNSATSKVTENASEIPIINKTKAVPINLWDVLKWIYFIGLSIMLFRFLVQLFSVYQQIKNSEITKGNGYYLAINNKDISPFSFWKYIVLNPNKYDEISFLQILEHERIHILQRHSIDMVIAELFLMVQWFNPLAWWHRHLVDQNLEFLVDQTLLENGENKQAYQYHLVQVAVPNIPLSISSNYNYSQLKNRIKMMNLQRSSIAAIWKYALLFPIGFMLLLAFTDKAGPSLTAQNIEKIESSYVIITPEASQTDLRNLQEKLYEFGYVLSFENLEYENDRIIEIDALLDYNDEMGIKIPYKWDKTSLGKQVALFVKEDFGRFGIHLNEIMINDLKNHIPKEQIFIAGNFPINEVLDYMRSQLEIQRNLKDVEFQKNIKDPNWPGKLTKAGRFYGPEISQKDIEGIKIRVKEKGYPTTYFLDGLEADETILNTPIREIENIRFNEWRYRKFDSNGKFIKAMPWNYEVRLKRKGKLSSPTKNEEKANDLEEIYIILTEEASIEEIKAIQEKLLKFGINLTFDKLEYNNQKRIEEVSATFEVDGNTGTGSWNKDGIGYHYMIFHSDWKNGSSSVSYEIGKSKIGNYINNNSSIKVLSMGVDYSPKGLNYLKEEDRKSEIILRKNLIKTISDPNWKGFPHRNYRVLKNLTEEKIKELKALMNQNPAKEEIFYLDGIISDKTILDIPPIKMRSIEINETNFVKLDADGNEVSSTFGKREINIKRKANIKIPNESSTKINIDEIYIILTQEASIKEIEEIQETLLNYNIQLKINQINFNANNNKIDAITATFKVGENVRKVSWKSNHQKYNYLVFGHNFKTGSTSAGSGKELIKEIKKGNKNSKLFLLGKENTSASILFLEKQISINKTINPSKKEEESRINAQNIINDFIHEPSSPHYLITTSSKNNLNSNIDFIRSNLFMRGFAHKYSSIVLDESLNEKNQLIIIRNFENFEQALTLLKFLERRNDYPEDMNLFPISKSNFKKVQNEQTINNYAKFYNNGMK